MKSPISIRRGTVAAVFIDLQEEHRKDKRYLVEGFADILANVQRLQEAARRNFVPLYHWAYIVDLAEARPFHPLDACRLMAGDTVSVWQVEGSVPLRFTFENAAQLYAEL
ncbi:MAG: hypothetical protein E5Y35_12660 [Mesorhizobium sp.]|nr:MAG: hypothetical protein E5Y35_12660 [Mesorhizobium sp.]